MKFNLQLHAETVAGSKLIYLYRLLSKKATETGVTLAFTTENDRTTSKDADATATKDGTVRTPGIAEVEISATSLLEKGDTMAGVLEQAMLDDELIEIWEVNTAEPAEAADGTYKSRYFQGYLTEFDKSSNAEDMIAISLTFGVNGTGADGYATVTDAQLEIASYVFADTTVSV